MRMKDVISQANEIVTEKTQQWNDRAIEADDKNEKQQLGK